MSDRVPIILDTDIGSDIDDAVALAYLLNQPRCELLGITTVSGQPEKRASLADVICRAAGRTDIPIHVGVEHPFLVAQHQPEAQQAETLHQWDHNTYDKRVTALEFLRDTIRARPGEITLLTIGPLTNIGLLFTIDPELPAMLKQLVMMGGRFFTKSHAGYLAEWNILCDPHAAQKVFAAPVPKLVAVGLDVTEQCQLEADVCRQRFTKAGGPLGPVATMAEVWFRGASHITFHDPLSAALIFEPELCGCEPAKIGVELHSPYTLAHTTHLPYEGQAPHQVARTVNASAFFDHYFQIVGG